MNKKFFISTPIYYASGKPHIGHAYTTLVADVINRYKKMLGYDTFFVTGSDEHGQKIETLATANNMTPQEFVDMNSNGFKNLFELMGIQYDKFIRTTDKNHVELVQKVFRHMLKNGDIYLDQWQGYYCVSCEENYTINQIQKKGDDLVCAVGHKITTKNEESYFFEMSKYADWLKTFLNDHPNFIIPSHRITELENNFLNNLMDLSISRTSIKWGIPIIENDKHVVYVWLDALFNYLSALGYLSDDDSKYQEFWNNNNSERLHLMSKEITRFHCIYWPIFLKSLNLNLPTQVLSHGWIVTKEGKMSKSLGNVIDPIEIMKNFGRDQLRYFLMKEISFNRDGIFSYDIFYEVINSDLANNIGNLVNRTIGMLKKYTDGVIPAYQNIVNKLDQHIESNIQELLNNLPTLINNYQINELLEQTVILVKNTNKYIEDLKPWELKKNNQVNELNSLLTHLCLVIQVVIYIMNPVLIDGTVKMANQMNIDMSKLSIEKCLDFNSLNQVKVNDAEPIFVRFEIDEKNK